jgi:DNA-binding PucR family transcriptional regulator
VIVVHSAIAAKASSNLPPQSSPTPSRRVHHEGRGHAPIDVCLADAVAGLFERRGGQVEVGSGPSGASTVSLVATADPRELLSTIAASLVPYAAELSGQLTARILDEEPELAADKPIADSLAASVLDNISTVLRVFEVRPDRDTVTAPAAALDYARRLAQRGIAISTLLRTYRLGQAEFQQAMVTEISKAGLDAATVAAMAAELSTVAFDYVDRISEDVVAAYQQERDNWMRSRIAARSARVMALLSTASVDLADVDKTLGYRLGQTHLGVIAWCDDDTVAADRITRLERSVARLAEAAEVPRPPLIVAADESTLWAWFPRPGSGRLEIRNSDDEDGVWIATGEPTPGVGGFRLTHRQARQAQTVALAADRAHRVRVTAWSQVGAVALMCADREALAAWVQHTLSDLALDEDGMARLRETLATFLATGSSYTASAQLLNLHKNTVQYRVRKAQHAIGRPLQDRRRDIELALDACNWLGAAVLRRQPAAR